LTKSEASANVVAFIGIDEPGSLPDDQRLRLFETLQTNPPRQPETQANFLTSIGRKPLKNPDSEK
jgi:hypothetical protein